MCCCTIGLACFYAGETFITVVIYKTLACRLWTYESLPQHVNTLVTTELGWPLQVSETELKPSSSVKNRITVSLQFSL